MAGSECRSMEFFASKEVGVGHRLIFLQKRKKR